MLRLCTEFDDEVRFPTFKLELDDDEDCLVAFEDFRCFDDEDDDVRLVVILMLVADVEDAVVLMVESISFSGEDPESEEVSWAMGL